MESPHTVQKNQYKQEICLNKSLKLSIPNKLTIYKAIPKLARIYGVELWGSVKPANN